MLNASSLSHRLGWQLNADCSCGAAQLDTPPLAMVDKGCSHLSRCLPQRATNVCGNALCTCYTRSGKHRIMGRANPHCTCPVSVGRRHSTHTADNASSAIHSRDNNNNACRLVALLGTCEYRRQSLSLLTAHLTQHTVLLSYVLLVPASCNKHTLLCCNKHTLLCHPSTCPIMGHSRQAAARTQQRTCPACWLP